MKAQSLWSGNDYAYKRYRGRGQSYATDIQRVKVIKTEEVKDAWKKNASTYATVEFLDLEGNPIPDRQTESVRARDIIDFWDDWWNDISAGEETNGERLTKHKAYVEEQRKLDEARRLEWRQKQEAREAEEAEKRAQLQIRRNTIRQKLENVGLNPDAVNISFDANSVTIHNPELTRWVEEGVRTIDI